MQVLDLAWTRSSSDEADAAAPPPGGEGDVELPRVAFRVRLELPESVLGACEFLRNKAGRDTVLEFPSLRLLGAFWGAVVVSDMEECVDLDDRESVMALYQTACVLGPWRAGLVRACEKAWTGMLPGPGGEGEFRRLARTARQFERIAFLVELMCLYVAHLDATPRGMRSRAEYTALFGDAVRHYEELHSVPVSVAVAPPLEHEPRAGGYAHLHQFEMERIPLPGLLSGVVFVLRNGTNNEPVLAAFKHVVGSAGFHVCVSNSAEPPMNHFRPGHVAYCARVSMNVLGTEFTVYDWKAKGGCVFPRKEVGCISYSRNVLGEVPNLFTVRLAGRQEELVCVRPKWNDVVGAHTLDFKGRARIPSKKNFLVRLQSSPEVKLLLGKVEKHRFSLDFTAPFSPVMAFAVALTAFENKLLVT